jgi:hypothetical protein
MANHSKLRTQTQAKKAQLATEGAQAMSEYNAERQAERAKTARLRELRLAKEAADIAMSLRAKKQIRNPGHHFTNAELAHRRPPELPLQRQRRPCDAYCGVRCASRSDPKDRSNRTKRALSQRPQSANIRVSLGFIRESRSTLGSSPVGLKGTCAPVDRTRIQA